VITFACVGFVVPFSITALQSRCFGPAAVGIRRAIASGGVDREANWSARVEYLYADFGSTRCAVFCGLAGTSFDFTTSAVRGGVNYRF
jgi:hypothetical protein